MADKFVEMLGPLNVQTKVDNAWRAKTDELASQFLTDEWLLRKRRSRAGREVKIRAGVQVKQGIHKAPGGLIRLTTEVQDGVIAAASISGDFFFFPSDRLTDLEAVLVGLCESDVKVAVARLYEEYSIESTGVTPADFARAL
jgi:lipoate-protein ligase A